MSCVLAPMADAVHSSNLSGGDCCDRIIQEGCWGLLCLCCREKNAVSDPPLLKEVVIARDA